ncbi:MAG: hypothetical protein AB7O24_11360 [Kofleriaceae bacterium]
MGMKCSCGSVICAVVVMLVATPPARADDVALAIQPLIGASTAISSTGAIANAPDGTPVAATVASGVFPAFRAGGETSSVAVYLDFAYTSATFAFEGESIGTSVFSLGIDVEPSFWWSADNRVQMYGLIGPLVSIARQPSSTGGTTTKGGGATLGMGGKYFVHPAFAVGFEVGLKMVFLGSDFGTAHAGSVYAAVTGTFSTRK